MGNRQKYEKNVRIGLKEIIIFVIEI